MCIKQFIGFSCGHCTIPTLRQCPLTAQNETFPACKFPAERVTQVEEMCHPCFRVVWKDNVLEEERRHMALHEQRLCECEVMFTDEERQRRMVPKPVRGKSKACVRRSRYRGDELEEIVRKSLSNDCYSPRRVSPPEHETEHNGVEHHGFPTFVPRDFTKPSSQINTMKWYPMNVEVGEYQYASTDETFVKPGFGMAPAPNSSHALQPQRQQYQQQQQQQGVVISQPFYQPPSVGLSMPFINQSMNQPPPDDALYFHQPSPAPQSPRLNNYRAPLVVTSDPHGLNVGGSSRSSSTPP